MKYHNSSKRVYKNLLILSAISLAACSSTQQVDNSQTKLENEALKKQLDQQKAEWEAVKPDIERLLALEEDFKLLIQSINTSQLSNSPENLGGEVQAAPLVPAPQNVSAVEDILKPENNMDEALTEKPAYVQAQFNMPASSTSKVNRSPTNKANMKSSQYAVQVAAYDNEIQLAKGWLRLQGSFPELMSTVNPIKEKVSVKQKSLWTLKVGPFVSRSAGSRYCSQLKERNQDCFVGLYQGEEL
ncbi:SPOR domain-containing protein [Marinomonas algicola]|uniref:SPOR domain-containing protein n=1 Tax=Marinomonas algicola TaxID=2773454 RepID=UPI00174D7493|nr:SPOR domain-containing protein [Marinomonas algicola]